MAEPLATGGGRFTAMLPPHWFMLGIALQVLLAVMVSAPLLASPWHVAGVLPVGAGMWLALAAHGRFVQAGTPVRPFERSTTVVTDGAFAWSRNPMYLGMLLVQLGIAVLLREWPGLLVVATFYLILRYGFVRREERFMEELFGATYRNYCARVRRWF